MSMNDTAQRIHDRATRGVALSAEEQASLDQWYAQLDQEEDAALVRTSASPVIAELRARMDVAVAQLQTAAQRIQVLTADNEALRKEIASLQRQLAKRTDIQPV